VEDRPTPHEIESLPGQQKISSTRNATKREHQANGQKLMVPVAAHVLQEQQQTREDVSARQRLLAVTARTRTHTFRRTKWYRTLASTPSDHMGRDVSANRET
jgi:hypothetical protein